MICNIDSLDRVTLGVIDIPGRNMCGVDSSSVVVVLVVHVMRCRRSNSNSRYRNRRSSSRYKHVSSCVNGINYLELGIAILVVAVLVPALTAAVQVHHHLDQDVSRCRV